MQLLKIVVLLAQWTLGYYGFAYIYITKQCVNIVKNICLKNLIGDKSCHVTDVTNASRTMLMNLKTLKWDDELCKLDYKF